MSPHQMGARTEQFSLSKEDYQFICDLVYRSSGIVLDERKREMVYRRLMRRTRDLKLHSFQQYCDLLKSPENEELGNFINAITTNLTSFFRESHHFDYLSEHFLPWVLKKNTTAKRLRIWSAGCSTGEEPYSIAITLMQQLGPLLDSWDARILATDLDTEVLKTGQQGIYQADRIKDLPESTKKKWFLKEKADNGGRVRAHPQLNELITFKQLNLLHEWPMRGPFDVIFCRNVIIYFDKPTQQELIARYFDLLSPGGLLILGHSENIGQHQKLFEPKGRTIFQKPRVPQAR